MAIELLMARRVVEAGARVVTVAYGFWDTHGQNFKSLRRQLPFQVLRAGDRHPVHCELCASGDPASRRPHGPELAGMPPAPPPDYQLWPAL